MSEIAALLSTDHPDLPILREHLDGLDAARRVRTVQRLDRRALARLFDAAAGYRPVGLEDIVPADVPPMTPVRHDGKNSLPVFTRFAKVFCRPDGSEAERAELWGYNSNNAFIGTLVGPGYFVAYPHDVEGEVLIDYLRLPPRHPDEWPPILPNDARLSRFVYNGTQDVLRGVSKHVTIGRATRGGKPMDAWFALCRAA